MLTEDRLARNKVLIRCLNQRVAVISETLEMFGALRFRCECGIYPCRKQLALTTAEYEAIRSEPTRFLVHPDHVLHALESVVLEHGSYVVVEGRGGRKAGSVATEPRVASEAPLVRAADAFV